MDAVRHPDQFRIPQASAKGFWMIVADFRIMVAMKDQHRNLDVFNRHIVQGGQLLQIVFKTRFPEGKKG